LEGRLVRFPLEYVEEGPVTLKAVRGLAPVQRISVYGEMGEVPTAFIRPSLPYTYTSPFVSGGLRAPPGIVPGEGMGIPIRPLGGPPTVGRLPVTVAPITGLGVGTQVLPGTRTMTAAQVARLRGPVPTVGVPYTYPYTREGITPRVAPSTVPYTSPFEPLVTSPTPTRGPWVRPVPLTTPWYTPLSEYTPFPFPAPVPTPFPQPEPYPFPTPTPTPVPTPVPTEVVTKVGLRETGAPKVPPLMFGFPKVSPFSGFAQHFFGGAEGPGVRGIWEITGHPVYGPSPITGEVVGRRVGREERKYGAVPVKRKVGIVGSRLDGGGIGQSTRNYKVTVVG